MAQKKVRLLLLWTAHSALGAPPAASFSSGWRFYRGNEGGADFASATFDDSRWRMVDVPHDSSSEDLPARELDESTPVLAVRAGEWKFAEGEGNSTTWPAPAFNDSSWRSVTVPKDWRDYGYEAKNATGWYRRTFQVSEAQLDAAKAGQLRLALGEVASADVTWINGVQVGSIGTMGQQKSCTDPLVYRSYPVDTLSGALHVGTNLVAVKVWSAGGPKAGGPRRYVHAQGALPAGGDVMPKRRMRPADAIDACNASDSCLGLTFKSETPSPSGLVDAYFKNEVTANGDAGWQSWVVNQGQPGGLADAQAPGDARIGPFDAGASPGQKQTGYTVGGVSWYRKHFPTPRTSAGTAGPTFVFVEGCYMNCQLYLNGKALGAEHPYGYTSFATRLPAELLRPALLGGAADNVLAVRVRQLGSNSRWYAGAGLFRPVSLHVFEPMHIAPFWSGGVHITTPEVRLKPDSDGKLATATANVSVTLRNDALSQGDAASLHVSIVEKATGKEVASRSVAAPPVPPNSTASLSVSIPLGEVATWSPEQPALFEAKLSLGEGRQPELATFGVRTFSFDASTGLHVNGVPTKLRGGCVHHDNGPLGSRAIGRAEERRVELLKASGYNAIRTSHNPVSRAFVSACERLGVILMEEAFDTWSWGKNADDYHLYFDAWWERDMESMVLRDRNSPAILLWSIGNEIPMRHTPQGAALSQKLADKVRALDPAPAASTRAVTSAYPMPSADAATDAFFAPLDVAGYNYAHASVGRDHARVPSRVFVATETFPAQSVENYEASHNASAPYFVGTFIWTAIDYIGESAIGANGHYPPSQLACGDYCAQPFPYHISFCGDLDIVGELKPQARLRRVLWNASALEISVHRAGAEVIGLWGYRDERQSWTWPGMPSGMNLTVRAYAARGCVTLTVRGKPATSDGCVRAGPSAGYVANFAVGYDEHQPGELRASLHEREGAPVLASVALQPAGAPVGLRLSADRAALSASRDELSYVRAELVDAAGHRVDCGTYEGGGVGLAPDAAGGAAAGSALALVDGTPSSSPFSPPSWCGPVAVSFSVEGDAELAAVGTGDPTDLTSFSSATRSTFRGLVTAIVRPGGVGRAPSAGTVRLRASATGLKGAEVTLTVG